MRATFAPSPATTVCTPIHLHVAYMHLANKFTHLFMHATYKPKTTVRAMTTRPTTQPTNITQAATPVAMATVATTIKALADIRAPHTNDMHHVILATTLPLTENTIQNPRLATHAHNALMAIHALGVQTHQSLIPTPLWWQFGVCAATTMWAVYTTNLHAMRCRPASVHQNPIAPCPKRCYRTSMLSWTKSAMTCQIHCPLNANAWVAHGLTPSGLTK